MLFLQELNKAGKQFDTTFDLAAFCYDFMLRFIQGKEAVFLGTYIYENEKAKENNPNIKQLVQFSDTIVKILEKQFKEALRLEKCLEEIEKSIADIAKGLRTFGTKEENELTIPYFILLAIDRYVKGKTYSEVKALNEVYSDRTYIYLKNGNTILETAAKSNEFPEPISDNSIKNNFDNLIFLNKEICVGKEAPAVVSLYIDKEDKKRQEILKGKKLKIAVIPFGKQKMLKFPVEKGGIFTVEYEEEHMQNGADRALRLLEAAIDKKANIIVFPEFVCNQQIQEAIQKKIEELYRTDEKRMQNLLLVIAGTRWSNDNNNVCFLYGYDGRLLGKQYKTVSFSDTKSPKENLMEGLQNPGKETTFVDIDGIGRVMIGICKDVCTGDYTKQLAATFCPQLLFVPAWSRSIKRGFSEQLREITVKNHETCSVMCNCCEAMNDEIDKNFRETIGLVVTPNKTGTVIIGKEREIKRKEAKCMQCDEKGCLFMLSLNFEAETVKNGQIVRKIEQIIP